VIRNNSTYFGVDRLPHAVSFTTSPVAIADLQNLTAGDFSSSGFFGSWSHPSSDSPPNPAMVSRLSEMLDRLDQFNLEFSQWLEGQGRSLLLDFLEAKIKSGTPINLGLIDDKDGFILPGPSVILVPTLRLIQTRRKNGKPFFDDVPERKTHRLVLITGTVNYFQPAKFAE
jgi:hypothetical protein